MARGAKDPQVLHPALGERARILFVSGRRPEARVAIEELLAVVAATGTDLNMASWFVSAVLVLGAEGRGAELVELARSAPPTPWIEAGKAIAVGNFVVAADGLGTIGSRPEEAFARLLAGEQLAAEGRGPEAEAQLGLALEFYRSVDASAYVQRAEALLRSTA